MTEASNFGGERVSRVYDRHLGPVIFAGMGVEMAGRVAARRPARVLETAAGTGIVTRSLRDTLPWRSDLVATDVQADMLALARTKFRDGERVDFQAADATSLPFPDASFDAVVCQFGAMFFSDRAAACREARRVLEPGGSAFFSVWDSHAHNAFARLAHEVVSSAFEADAPTFLEVAYAYSRTSLERALSEAGFDDVVGDTVRQRREVRDVGHFARGMIFGSPVADQVRARGRSRPEDLAGALTARYRSVFGPDPARISIQACLVEARRA